MALVRHVAAWITRGLRARGDAAVGPHGAKRDDVQHQEHERDRPQQSHGS
jgi:hypothetical protein